MGGECQLMLAGVPAYIPQLLAFLIAFVEFLALAVAYAFRELQRQKTFYGREDFEDIPEEEKLAHEGAMMGTNVEEMKIVQSNDRTIREQHGSVGTPSGKAGVRVMMRRKRTGRLSGDHTDSPGPQTPGNINIRFTLDLDKTARGFEFMNLLEKSLPEMDELKNIRYKLKNEVEDHLCEFLVCKLRTILEESTHSKWVVHGVIQERLWKVSGQENLLEQGDVRTHQMLRITVHGATTPIQILAYMVEVEFILQQLNHAPPPVSPNKPALSRVSFMRTESATQTITSTPAPMSDLKVMTRSGHDRPHITIISPAQPTTKTSNITANTTPKLATSTKSDKPNQATRQQQQQQQQQSPAKLASAESMQSSANPKQMSDGATVIQEAKKPQTAKLKGTSPRNTSARRTTSNSKSHGTRTSARLLQPSPAIGLPTATQRTEMSAVQPDKQTDTRSRPHSNRSDMPKSNRTQSE